MRPIGGPDSAIAADGGAASTRGQGLPEVAGSLLKQGNFCLP